jgi:hypothetical protein
VHRYARIALLVALLAPGSADAVTRGIRIDFAGDWGDADAAYAIGSPQCAGSSSLDTLVRFRGYTFSGYDDPGYEFDTDTYCQRTVPYDPSAPFDPYFSSASFFTGDEPGLAALVGANTDNAVSAIRYAYLGGPRFSEPNGFQWAFYFFPHGVTVVGLYGLTAIPLTDEASWIEDPTGSRIWLGATDGYTTEYFCFKDVDGATQYLGTWNGSLQESGACAAALGELFTDGFEY